MMATSGENMERRKSVAPILQGTFDNLELMVVK
jgi:hypothetical protein